MKTAEEIFEEMLELFEAWAGYGVNTGCDMAVRLRAAAEEIADAYAEAENVKAQCFAQTATGEHLDRHAEMRGLSRRAAAFAAGEITFTAPSAAAGALTVPRGTVCVTAAGLEFETTEEGAIPQGGTECTVAARCLTPGKIGNAPAGMVSYMTAAPVGVASCRNEAAFTGGADAESDEDLRKRVTSSFRRLPNGANAAYYEQAALSVEGVRAAAVTPRANGRGTVKVTVASESGVPSAPF